MEITLSPEDQTRAEQIAASGRYDSVESLLRFAVARLLNLHRVQEKTGLSLDEMQRKVAEAERERADYFDSVSLEEFFDQIKMKGCARTDAPQTASV